MQAQDVISSNPPPREMPFYSYLHLAVVLLYNALAWELDTFAA